jgi:hypothetical protein
MQINEESRRRFHGFKLTVISHQGKEAAVAVLGSGDFVGEGCPCKGGHSRGNRHRNGRLRSARDRVGYDTTQKKKIYSDDFTAGERDEILSSLKKAIGVARFKIEKV